MRISDWSSDVCSSDLLDLLDPENLALDGIGETDAAGLCDRLAVFLKHQRAEDRFAMAAAEVTVWLAAGENVLEDHGEEEGLEVLRGLLGLCRIGGGAGLRLGAGLEGIGRGRWWGNGGE